MSIERSVTKFEYERVIDDICGLEWAKLTEDEAIDVAWAYYFFSIQFRENLLIARELYPEDENLERLEREECNTDNLSPWPGVARDAERLNHDEFMSRALGLKSLPAWRRGFLSEIGGSYLQEVRASGSLTRALSIASYEDGGLERVFRAMLKMPDFDCLVLRAFRHFLIKHIGFDSDSDQGHGALVRHLQPDDRILPLWSGFRRLLTEAVPRLAPALVDVTLVAAK